MLLCAQWYTQIADDQEKVRNNRPALKIIFLVALAESIAKQRIGINKIKSSESLKKFFDLVLPEDKKIMMCDFQRALTKPGHHTLLFSSIIKILYEVRNKAVHGEDYFSFSFLDKKQKNEFENQGYNSWSFMTFGYLGKPYKKRQIALSLKITYDEFRDIVVRTAIENIKSLLD